MGLGNALGPWEGEPYDGVMRDIVFNHVALVRQNGMTPAERELLLTISEQLCRPPGSITSENAESISRLVAQIRLAQSP